MTPIVMLALLGAILLCIGWLFGYAMGKSVGKHRVRVVHPEPEMRYVTRLNSRHIGEPAE